MKRGLVLTYGLASYVGFLAVFLYLLGFIGGFLTPTRLDGPANSSIAENLIIDLLLVAAFGLQHSVMARCAPAATDALLFHRLGGVRRAFGRRVGPRASEEAGDRRTERPQRRTARRGDWQGRRLADMVEQA